MVREKEREREEQRCGRETSLYSRDLRRVVIYGESQRETREIADDVRPAIYFVQNKTLNILIDNNNV